MCLFILESAWLSWLCLCVYSCNLKAGSHLLLDSKHMGQPLSYSLKIVLDFSLERETRMCSSSVRSEDNIFWLVCVLRFKQHHIATSGLCICTTDSCRLCREKRSQAAHTESATVIVKATTSCKWNQHCIFFSHLGTWHKKSSALTYLRILHFEIKYELLNCCDLQICLFLDVVIVVCDVQPLI